MTLRSKKEITDEIAGLQTAILLTIANEQMTGEQRASLCVTYCWAIGALLWVLGEGNSTAETSTLTVNQFVDSRGMDAKSSIQTGRAKH